MTRRSTPAVDIGALVLGRELGRDGHGTFHEVTNKAIRTSDGHDWDVVYKQYGAAVLPRLDTAALAAMPDLLETLSPEDAQWLCEKTAWPGAVVERGGSPCGFVMRAVPDRFRFAFRSSARTRSGTPRLARLEHLLGDDAHIARIGSAVSDRDRLLLLADVAKTLARLHRFDIAVGALAPKNLLFATTPQPECFLIDCDAAQLRGGTALPEAAAPDWQHPDGEHGTRAGDIRKFGLLAIRLFARDHTATNPARLAAISPTLADLARASLDPAPIRRPALAEWAEQLTAAAAHASTTPGSTPPRRRRTLSAPSAPGPGAARSRRPATLSLPATGPSGGRHRTPIGVGAAVLVTILAIAAIIVGTRSGSDSRSTADTSDDKYDYSVTTPATSTTTATSRPSTSTPSEPPDVGPYSAPTPTRPAADAPTYAAPTYQAPAYTPPDPIEDARAGSCFNDYGTGGQSDLRPTACEVGAFKVLRIFTGTTDLNSCDNVPDYDQSVSSSRHRLVLCLTYLHSSGAYHAEQGDCVYGTPGNDIWATQTCVTGNFKVRAVYRGVPDKSKCDTHYWLTMPVTAHPGLGVLLCLTFNYPDDAAYAETNNCLLRSGSGSGTTFTNTGSCASSNVVVVGRTNRYDPGFCGRYGWTAYQSRDYPQFAYTVCWRTK
ncbi:MAG TPA: hypothetical protein VLH10_19230 [Yinghuangia sp.]|nr:hypothetical protein [Yinghuangia sp.]